jgi:hypothetical protein
MKNDKGMSLTEFEKKILITGGLFAIMIFIVIVTTVRAWIG